jgi:hypothetical protein
MHESAQIAKAAAFGNPADQEKELQSAGTSGYSRRKRSTLVMMMC